MTFDHFLATTFGIVLTAFLVIGIIIMLEGQ